MDVVKTPQQAAVTVEPPPGEPVPAIELVKIAKTFSSRRGIVTAVDAIDLVIGEGEFFSLLGPSGCGKTTTLRMIGGFEEPTEGQILLYGDDVVGVPPNHRDVNMVFQSYALFPHMSVFENVAFGLRRKAVSKAETKARVGDMLDLVQLDGKSDRRPRELSGGQQQRVALARALVNRPRALLLDEPLAALDLKLRQAMQLELKRIQREVGITFVFVTHDQNEALTMSDRLVVMNAGRIEQLGSPREVYEHPRTRFVAGFIGTSNLITGRVRAMDGSTALLEAAADECLVVPEAASAGAGVGRDLDVTVRPEKIVISEDRPGSGRCAIRGRVAEVVYLGTSTQYAVATAGGTELSVFVQNASDADDIAGRGADVWLSWRPDHSLALVTTQPAPAESRSDLSGGNQ
ncbi:MAG: spermidine/putrescine transport system ATP-binding protein [Pseudonocardiales bacterium]|jgi:spermidine/putrescine transport system ATP-binding protein|nr:spermidine/putrescine transporter ATPase subunit [Jatrophihabitans sp.]MDT4931549.1 spermidine/putrescine transport system ATP-binding protein [Pseudonocardiales bacterium]